jgi:hypothetical protein
MDNKLAFEANSSQNGHHDNKLQQNQLPTAFKFGQVDQKKLLSRLYSTPFQKVASNKQDYVLEMYPGQVGINKPRIRKLETPPKPVEPVQTLHNHQLWNSPEQIHNRNREFLINQGKLRLEKSPMPEIKRKKHTHEAAIELGEDIDMKQDESTLKFVPHPPPPRRNVPSPIGKHHIKAPKVKRERQEDNFEGETNMLRVFDFIRNQEAGFFLYLTHTYPKNSVNYNFYEVKLVFFFTNFIHLD